MVQLLKDSYDILSFLIPEFLDMLVKGISSLHEQLARISIFTMKNLADNCGDKFDENLWVCFLEKFENLLKITTPYELRDDLIDSTLTFDVVLCIEKCIIQRQLIEICNDIGKQFSHKFPETSYINFIENLETVYEYARTYNDNVGHRILI